MTQINCFCINSYFQFENLIQHKKNKRKTLIIHIRNNLVESFGIEWLSSLIQLINKNYKNYNIKFYVDTGNNYGLSILIMKENIHFLKLKANNIIMRKINQIAKKNKVLLNPSFNIVNVSKIKNYEKLKL